MVRTRQDSSSAYRPSPVTHSAMPAHRRRASAYQESKCVGMIKPRQPRFSPEISTCNERSSPLTGCEPERRRDERIPCAHDRYRRRLDHQDAPKSCAQTPGHASLIKKAPPRSGASTGTTIGCITSDDLQAFVEPSGVIRGPTDASSSVGWRTCRGGSRVSNRYREPGSL